MNYLEYKETIQHGSIGFPFAFYRVTPLHPRYLMLHHWHPEYELIHIRKGQMELQIENDTIHASPGDYVLITGGMVHNGIPKDCVYECLVFDLNFFQTETHPARRELQAILEHDWVLTSFYPAANREFCEILDRIFIEFSEKKTGYEFLLEGGLCQFLGLVLRNGCYSVHSQINGIQKRIRIFKAALTYIHAHYKEELNLTEMAENAGMNPHYFCRFFKEISGQTPVQYLNYYRIEAACEKLASSSQSITEIAFDCGFQEASYFVKVFKKFKGQTPSNYCRAFGSSAQPLKTSISHESYS